MQFTRDYQFLKLKY